MGDIRIWDKTLFYHKAFVWMKPKIRIKTAKGVHIFLYSFLLFLSQQIVYYFIEVSHKQSGSRTIKSGVYLSYNTFLIDKDSSRDNHDFAYLRKSLSGSIIISLPETGLPNLHYNVYQAEKAQSRYSDHLYVQMPAR